MHLQVVIPMLDRQETSDLENPGHYFNITIDFISREFKVFDSYRTNLDKNLRLTTFRVVKIVKNLWIEGFGNDSSISNFDITFSDMPKTTNK